MKAQKPYTMTYNEAVRQARAAAFRVLATGGNSREASEAYEWTLARLQQAAQEE